MTPCRKSLIEVLLVLICLIAVKVMRTNVFSERSSLDRGLGMANFHAQSTRPTGKGYNQNQHIVFGYSLVKGKSKHPMEDYHVSEFRKVKDRELGLFAIYDGHLGQSVAEYLQSHLFDNILKESDFSSDPVGAMREAYLRTDGTILDKAPLLGPGGSTAVTAILIDGVRLLVANVGDSRAVLSRGGQAIQLSVDHEPSAPKEKGSIEEKGGFVSNMPGDVPRVDGQLAVARAFGDKSLKIHLSARPDIRDEYVDLTADCFILASDGLWKVMQNQEAVDLVVNIKDPEVAAKRLTDEAVSRKSKDDISCIVVRFRSKGATNSQHEEGLTGKLLAAKAKLLGRSSESSRNSDGDKRHLFRRRPKA